MGTGNGGLIFALQSAAVLDCLQHAFVRIGRDVARRDLRRRHQRQPAQADHVKLPRHFGHLRSASQTNRFRGLPSGKHSELYGWSRIGVRNRRHLLTDWDAPLASGRGPRSRVRHVDALSPVAPVAWARTPFLFHLHPREAFLRPWRLDEQTLLFLVSPIRGIFDFPEVFARGLEGKTCHQNQRGSEPGSLHSNPTFYRDATATIGTTAWATLLFANSPISLDAIRPVTALRVEVYFRQCC